MTGGTPILFPSQLDDFRRDGVLVLHGFYDTERELLPIQRDIHGVIGQVMARHGMPDLRPTFAAATFDDGYLDLIARDRSYGGEVYDAVKQIPAFIRLLSDCRHEQLFGELRAGAHPAIAAGGYGIRIDNPGEDRFRAEWHQEYPSQLRSVDGLVFWSPLRDVTPEMGPVRFAPGSHRLGPLPVWQDASAGKSGAYALRLKGESGILAKFAEIAPPCSRGDLVVVDFLTLHASGFNRSRTPRWSMQFRYFNFNDPVGKSHGWCGSFASGTDFRKIHPELWSE